MSLGLPICRLRPVTPCVATPNNVRLPATSGERKNSSRTLIDNLLTFRTIPGTTL